MDWPEVDYYKSRAFEQWMDDDLKNEDDNLKIKRYAAPMIIADQEGNIKIADVLITQKITLDRDARRIYSLEIDQIIPNERVQGVTHSGPGAQTDGQSLVRRTSPPADVDKLQAKHEKIKSFLKENSKKVKKYGFRHSISPVYTGSAADYDKPSLQYIGSGEGAQVYGWRAAIANSHIQCCAAQSVPKAQSYC